MEIEKHLLETFKERYIGVHPLIFHRSIELARSLGDLFDILEGLPDYPLTWSDEDHCWKMVNHFSH